MWVDATLDFDGHERENYIGLVVEILLYLIEVFCAVL